MINSLKEVIDFKTTKIFEQAGTYTSIFLCDNSNMFHSFAYKESIEDKIIFKDKRFFLNKNYNVSIFEKEHSFVFKTFGPIATLRDNIYKNTSEVNIEDTVAFLKLTDLKSVEDIKNNKERIIFPYKFSEKFIPKEEYELF